MTREKKRYCNFLKRQNLVPPFDFIGRLDSNRIYNAMRCFSLYDMAVIFTYFEDEKRDEIIKFFNEKEKNCLLGYISDDVDLPEKDLRALEASIELLLAERCVTIDGKRHTIKSKF